MNRILIHLVYLPLLFTPLKASAATCKSVIASGYAQAIANQQFSKSTFAHKPFQVKNVQEVTNYYFKEAGLNQKQIVASLKNDPIEVHQVFLQSKNNWECNYFVILSTSPSRFCDFNGIRFQFCSQ